MRTVFIPVKDLTPLPGLSKLLPFIKSFSSLSITSTVQFSHRLPVLESFLKRKGFIVHVCDPVLGCRSVVRSCDAVIIIATGFFHAVSLALSSERPVFIVNPHLKSVKPLDVVVVKSFLKKQAARIHRAINSNNFGILVSKKSGQHDLSLAREIKRVLEGKKRFAVILVADELSPLNINNFSGFDCFINTACPRLVEDVFEKPVVNWSEVSVYF